MRKIRIKSGVLPFFKNPLTHRVSLFVAFLVILNLLYPARRYDTFPLKEGSIADRDYIAPSTFAIRKNKAEIDKERRQAMEGILPILGLEGEVEVRALEDSRLFLLDYEEVDSIMKGIIKTNKDTLKTLSGNIISQIMGVGIVTDMKSIPVGSKGEVVVRREGVEETRGKIFDLNTAIMWTKEKGMEIFLGDEGKTRALVEVIRHSIKPNLVYLKEETEGKRLAAADSVKTTKGVVLKGEMIVRAHDPITKEALEKLSSLAIDMGKGFSGSGLVGRNLLFAVSVFVFILLVYLVKKEIIFDVKKLVLISIICLFVISAGSIIIRNEGSPYVIPVAMGGMLLAILMGILPAIASVISLSFLVSVFIGPGDVSALFPLPVLVASVVIASRIRKFSDFSKAVPLLAAVSIFVALGFEVYKGAGYKPVLVSCGFAAIGGIASGVLALGLIPLFERIFAITTDLTLRELTDLNHPLLQELSVHAPGTYNHSMSVSAMVESAAHSISARWLLARAGAYYHDIGKLKNPVYFVENQREKENPHDKLRPRVSASILRMHVKDGVKRAKTEKLPSEIIDIIKEHHGKTLMESLYYKAEKEDGKIDEKEFRYDGPSPQSKESALVMLADGIEASVRSLENPTSNRIKEQIDKMVKKRVEEGELDDVALTFKDIRKIKEAFFPILMGLFHPRIVYKDKG